MCGGPRNLLAGAAGMARDRACRPAAGGPGGRGGAPAASSTPVTDPQIGDRLFISRRTVQTHLVHIFAKLDIAALAQLAAEVTRHQQEPSPALSHRLRTDLLSGEPLRGGASARQRPPLRRAAESSGLQPDPRRVRRRRDPPDGGCLMRPWGGTVKTLSSRDGHDRRRQGGLILLEGS